MVISYHVLDFMDTDMIIRILPAEVRELNSQKVDLKIKLAAIKSIQLEFVEHSLLSRNLIKLDKQLEKNLGILGVIL